MNEFDLLKAQVTKIKTAAARNIVDKIIEDLSDRRGLRQEWNSIDEDIKEEIIQVWTNIIIENL